MIVTHHTRRSALSAHPSVAAARKPLPLTSLAAPHPITLIESHPYKNHRGRGYTRSFTPFHQIPSAAVFSCTYKLPIFYPLCFDIHPCNGGGGAPSDLKSKISKPSTEARVRPPSSYMERRILRLPMVGQDSHPRRMRITDLGRGWTGRLWAEEGQAKGDPRCDPRDARSGALGRGRTG